jgi:hypothetical protein
MRYNTWKSRDFPFLELARAEVSRLFAYYLGLKEVTPLASGNYKVYAGDGNNGQLVVRLLKSRGWWVATEDINEAHLVWTQHPVDLKRKAPESPAICLLQQSAVSFAIPSN